MKIGMVSNYPPQEAKHINYTSAVSSYSKNLATAIAKHSDVELMTFVDKLDNGREEYREGNVEVIRCWEKGILYPFQILREVLRHRRELDVVHIQHEYFLYGSGATATIFPLMLLLLKCLKKPIIVTLHGIVPLSEFNETFAKENYLRGNRHILQFGLALVTKLICRLAHKVIVHEHNLCQVLVLEYGIKPRKVITIHHGIEERSILVKQNESRGILGIKGKKVVMFFGFISGYKGLDTLLEAFSNLPNKDYVLLIVGGEHPRERGDPQYANYVHLLKEKAYQSPNEIRFTGFVPEHEIPVYFSAADVVVLPYRRVMSASGPLTLCITFRRPFLLSDAFMPVVGDRNFLFKNNPKCLKTKIEEFFRDDELEKQGLQWGDESLRERSWDRIVEATVDLYKNP